MYVEQARKDVGIRVREQIKEAGKIQIVAGHWKEITTYRS